MNILNSALLSIGVLLLCSCSPVKTPVAYEYQLNAFSGKKLSSQAHRTALLVTAPESAAGYQTQEMLYVKKPYQLTPFAKNAWTNPPGDMLYPLLVQSLQQSGYFGAVISSPYTEGADYRLDTQLLRLQQNFIKRPSVIELAVKVVLTRVADNKVVSSKIVSIQKVCPRDNPYGGVIAANNAAYQLTQIVSEFVVSHITHRSSV